MNFGLLGRKILPILSRHFAAALFFCVMFLTFVVTCHPFGVTNHIEIVGTKIDCCSDHMLGGVSDDHESVFSQTTISKVLDISFPSTTPSSAIFSVFTVVLAISVVIIKQRQRLLAWLWATPWPFAWNGGYLSYFNLMRDA